MGNKRALTRKRIQYFGVKMCVLRLQQHHMALLLYITMCLDVFSDGIKAICKYNL